MPEEIFRNNAVSNQNIALEVFHEISTAPISADSYMDTATAEMADIIFEKIDGYQWIVEIHIIGSLQKLFGIERHRLHDFGVGSGEKIRAADLQFQTHIQTGCPDGNAGIKYDLCGDGVVFDVPFFWNIGDGFREEAAAQPNGGKLRTGRRCLLKGRWAAA